jgi:hypothetical protein
MRNIERGTIVRCEVVFAEIDPQELQNMEEHAMKNVVEKLGRVFFWVHGKKYYCYNLKV